MKHDDIVGGWKIIRQLGWGQSGKVYEVRETGGRRQTHALKIWTGIHLKVTAGEFRQEIAFAKDNNVPAAMPTFFASGEIAGSPFYVMELLEPLPDELDEKALVRIGCELIDAVGELHHNGWFHGDIKPSNLALKNGHVRLIDFGSACRLNDVATQRIRIGSRRYRAPEVLTDGKVSVLSEIFSIGMTLHDLCREREKPLFGDFFRYATATDPIVRPQSLSILRTLLISAAAQHRQQVAAESRLPKFKAVVKWAAVAVATILFVLVTVNTGLYFYRRAEVERKYGDRIAMKVHLRAGLKLYERGDMKNAVRHLRLAERLGSKEAKAAIKEIQLRR